MGRGLFMVKAWVSGGIAFLPSSSVTKFIYSAVPTDHMRRIGRIGASILFFLTYRPCISDGIYK